MLAIARKLTRLISSIRLVWTCHNFSLLREISYFAKSNILFFMTVLYRRAEVGNHVPNAGVEQKK